MASKKLHKKFEGIEIKHCAKCKVWKPLTSFTKNKSLWDGLAAYCTRCKVKPVSQHKKSGAPRKEHIFIEGIEYKHCKACDQNLFLDCFTKAKTWDGLKNECVDCANSRGKKSYAADPLKKNAKSQNWYRQNKASVSLRTRARRTKVREGMTSEDIQESLAHVESIKNNPCWYCGELKDDMHIEHFHAVADGGKDYWWNLVMSCASCNLSKRTRHGYEIMMENILKEEMV